ncbi:MAG: ABC transporter ATP-binding protein [Verrucomicrobia bacterium]|nr:ABC transporter ATP-binding protein [Verrucomicrobiota bacterium]
MTKSPKVAISVQNVSFRYSRDQSILRNVSFEVQTSEFIGIIGPNGGGKTTLLKLLIGFLTPQEGTISIFGKPATRHPNGIAYVPQALHYDKQFPITIIDLVLGGRLSRLPWWGKFSKEDKEAALFALEQVNLVDFRDRPLGTLSGGQAQRALIARALAQDPSVLLLDEPMACVDVQAEADIYNVLNSIKENLTILMVTHDIRAIIQQVKRVLCVQGGVQSIEPSDLCEHFALGLYHFPLIQTPEPHFTKAKFTP